MRITRVLSRTTRAVLRLAIRSGNVRVRVHGANLLLPRDHALPTYVQRFPDYSTNVVRVASAVSRKYAGSPVIDIGANVGDTVNFLRRNIATRILAVEGDPHWLAYLRTNTASLADVAIAGVFVGASSGPQVLRTDRVAGTSAFSRDARSGIAIAVSTAEQLLDKFPEFKAARLVKVDTDGYDYEIVESFLAAGLPHAPIMFFEHDPHLTPDGVSQSERLRLSLLGHGYRRALYWDNFGRFVLAADIRDRNLWESLARYVPAPGSVYYWDVGAFHDADSDLADLVVAGELTRSGKRGEG